MDEERGAGGSAEPVPGASGGRPPAEAALALAEQVNRATVELHKLARSEAQARRGQADWGDWAKLANAARTAVLHAASCRDASRGLQTSG